MAQGTIGVNIQAGSARAAVEQIAAAERAGIPATWGTIGMSGGHDPMAAFAAAGVQTERVLMGTCIIQTWPRHPIVIAQQALAIESLAPGRFRLGIGPAHPQVPRTRYYIANQEEHHKKRSFKEELIALLRANGIEYDERYL